MTPAEIIACRWQDAPDGRRAVVLRDRRNNEFAVVDLRVWQNGDQFRWYAQPKEGRTSTLADAQDAAEAALLSDTQLVPSPADLGVKT